MPATAKGRRGQPRPPWAPRVEQAHIRRLYRLFARGIYDDELLREVGWGLHARGTDVLTIVRAVRGEVPCPECGAPVHRAAREYYVQLKQRPPRAVSVSCPACQARVTWDECRDALRDRPLCFDCRSRLEWDYLGNRLACTTCGKTWSWPQYRASVSRRKWLPCPHCRVPVRRPEQAQHPRAARRGDAEDVACPRCGGSARHAEGKIHCAHCGYEQKWATYRKRLKRRAEHLECAACGHRFTWAAWRQRYRGLPLSTGNPAPVEDFLARWPTCTTPPQQLIAIDALLHALHGQGAMAPLFVEGEAASVMALLDELATGGRQAEDDEVPSEALRPCRPELG
jgi:endogenous inhibitor of DNA gyrase (YacG/DUF329 family)